MRELRLSDPEYRAKMEEKERLVLEREKKRQERATKKKKIALAELEEQAEKGNQEAVRELAERKQYQVRATVKNYRKMRDDALSGDPIAKVRYEKTLAMRREAYHAKKSEQTA